MIREKILKSNEAVKKLIEAGYSIQGRTKNMEKVAVEKNNKLFYFFNYIEAAEKMKV
jgi:hypothetical protein